MSDLLPDVRQPWELEVGWFDTVARPLLEQATADELATAWTALVDQDMLLEQHDRASAEWRKALRYAERGLGKLLGSSKGGRRREIPAACRDLGSQQRAAFRRMAAVDHEQFVHYLAQAEEAAQLSRAAVARWAKRIIDTSQEAEARQVQADTIQPDAEGNGWKMIYGDFRERLADVPDGSADLIVTDPPYPAEFLPLWSDLAEVAARVLRPQGVMLAMSGKIHVDEVMQRLGQHLAYGWIYCQPLERGLTRIIARNILQEWKPVLAYSNGKWPSGRIDQHGDRFDSGHREKARYRWEQDAGPMVDIIKVHLPEGGLVVDPFAGTGSFGIAALLASCTFLGVEADADRFKTCTDRLNQSADGEA
jgi:site-specific DNA-methyltransferase (adenine-specific)